MYEGPTVAFKPQGPERLRTSPAHLHNQYNIYQFFSGSHKKDISKSWHCRTSLGVSCKHRELARFCVQQIVSSCFTTLMWASWHKSCKATWHNLLYAESRWQVLKVHGHGQTHLWNLCRPQLGISPCIYNKLIYALYRMKLMSEYNKKWCYVTLCWKIWSWQVAKNDVTGWTQWVFTN